MKINIFSVVRTDLSTLTQKFVTNKYIIIDKKKSKERKMIINEFIVLLNN